MVMAEPIIKPNKIASLLVSFPIRKSRFLRRHAFTVDAFATQRIEEDIILHSNVVKLTSSRPKVRGSREMIS